MTPELTGQNFIAEYLFLLDLHLKVLYQIEVMHLNEKHLQIL